MCSGNQIAKRQVSWEIPLSAGHDRRDLSYAQCVVPTSFHLAEQVSKAWAQYPRGRRRTSVSGGGGRIYLPE